MHLADADNAELGGQSFRGAVQESVEAHTARQLLPAYLACVVGAFVFAFSIQEWAARPAIYLWVAVEVTVCLTIVAWAARTLRLERTGPVGVHAARLAAQRRAVAPLLHLAHGTVWAATPVVFTTRTDRIPWMMVLLFVVSYVGAGAVIFAALPRSFRAFTVPSLLGLSVWMILANDDLRVLGLGGIVLLVMMDKYNADAGRTLVQAMEGQLRNRFLLDRIERTQALSSSIVETAAEAIFSVRDDGTIVRANAAADALASSETEIEGRNISSLLPMFEFTPMDDMRGVEMLLSCDDGSLREVLVSTSRVEHSELVTLIARDIGDRKQLERRLEHEASHDQLTGLLNRAALLICAEHAARRARQAGAGFGLLFVDLDRFKHVNDGLGHSSGDLMLQAVAERLVATVGSFDDVARMGGDEFVVLLEREASLSSAVDLGERICRVLEEPYRIGEHEPFISASIGLAWSADASAEPRELIKRADMAMYRAKAEGRRRLVIFDQEMQHHADERSVMEWALRRAVDDGELTVVGQPIVDLDGILRGVELLARWDHPSFGQVPPMTFIPIAEESGLIVDIGRWVLREACRLLESWSTDPATASLGVSINISGLHLKAGLAEDLVEALDGTGFDPARLTLEVTETHLMSDLAAHRDVLVQVRDLGVGIALDDFGTGYSSLAYFATLPATSIKVDKSFVSDVAHDEHARAIVAAICTLAKSFGRSVVLEGIETDEQRRLAGELGADLLQGYLFGRPSAIEIAESAAVA